MTKHLISNKSLNKTTKKIGKHINATSNYLGNEVVEVKNNLVSNYKKNTFTWNISLLILVIICYLILIKNKPIIKLSDLLVNPIYLFKNQVQPMSMKRPFLNIYDDKGNKTNVVFITHPFTRDECIVQYNEAKKKGNHFLGMSSYCEFPAIVSNPHDVLHDPTIDAWAKYNYYELTEGWCHCFREPDKYITDPIIKKALISESDFAPFENHKPDPSVEKEYDFIYICLKDNDKCDEGWQSYNRNWELAQKCLDVMCKKHKLKGLLVGRINCKVPDSCHQMMELTDFLEYSKFISIYNKSKFIFVPNNSDASPRVLTEAMCFDLPILVNHNIVGGWKYVDNESGMSFKDENDLETKLDGFIDKVNKKQYHSRKHFVENYGYLNSGKKLLDFVVECIPSDKLNFNPSNTKYLKPSI
jgi:hypothetical protein